MRRGKVTSWRGARCPGPYAAESRGAGRAAVTTSSYLVLLRAGFTWPAGRPAAGGLLPHLFTLTCRRFSGDQPRPAVVFFGTFLRVAPTGCCPAPRPL